MAKQYTDSRMVVFAREPLLGSVKTRLVTALGEERTLALYEAMLSRTVSQAQLSDLTEVDLWVSSNISHQFFLNICNKKNIFLQYGKDLGLKMANAIEKTFQLPSIKSVVLIGTDCPAMTSEYIESAFAALKAGSDVVLGPATDGGYVLIGVGKVIPKLFEGIQWGGDRVLAATIDKIRSQNLKCQLLDMLWDVDCPEDLVRLEELEPPLALMNHS